jgi:hypothetical protein
MSLCMVGPLGIMMVRGPEASSPIFNLMFIVRQWRGTVIGWRFFGKQKNYYDASRRAALVARIWPQYSTPKLRKVD